MDEDSGVKVTRLRRRLSVETEGVQSPATPSTPTKKRGTRLAKPALELINENVTENVPKKTSRKSIARDVVEPTEEKIVTPSRRSVRIRSNTSLVMDATPNVVDSPRARRAARRYSQIDSDTETTTTPARQNRRNRKDSTSSVKDLAVSTTNEKVIAEVADVIIEEPEKEIKDSKVEQKDENSQSPTLRKSPRINKKGKKSIDEAVKDISDKIEQKDKSHSDTSKLSEVVSASENTPANFNTNDKSENKLESKDSDKENLSQTSTTLINAMEVNLKKSSGINKSTSAIEESDIEINHRKRTKSWTTLSNSLPTEAGGHNSLASGDCLIKTNEKYDIKSSNKSINKSDLISNSSIENKENINILKSGDILDASDTLNLFEKDPGKGIQSMVIIEDSDSNSSNGKLPIDVQNNAERQHNDGEDQCVSIQQTKPKRLLSESFTVEPMDIDETIPENITINDFSDKTNSSRDEEKVTDSKRKSSISDEKSIVHMNESSNKSKRTSSISLQQGSNNSKRKSSMGTSEENNNDSKGASNKFDTGSFTGKSQRKSSISMKKKSCENPSENMDNSYMKSSLSQDDSENNKRRSSATFQAEDDETKNKSNKNSVSKIESQNIDNTSNETKSTLVLSQLKDVDELSNVSKSLNVTNNELSKSVDIPTKQTHKKNLSHNYLTSTPLQQKSKQNVAMQINTPIKSPIAERKNISKNTNTKSFKKKVSNVNDNPDSSSDEDSSEKCIIIDDEAEEASDNYESGDSREEEERQYENEHEVLGQGETLESNEQFSNDSDYEKDSFIVSSDEEDDLLSGTGDDLSLSDNELKMTAKSKKKFDERKRKEQKKASKEMYESRHSLNESDKNSNSKTKKNKRQRLKSSVLKSEQEDEAQPKKKNRMRIDSSQDESLNKSDADGLTYIKKKKVKRLSESVCEDNDNANEKEITICNQSMNEKNDPLSLAVKQEPKTPQKDLNMSMVLINETIEEVQVEPNVSVMKSNETSDPLQATLVNVDECDSDISENVEIRENYDSVLENLNKSNNKQKKIKTLDSSLDLNKKTKIKVKEAIVDQLNLTQIKKSKKNMTPVVTENEIIEKPSRKSASVSSAKNDDGDTSDSIDVRLLFPEDSNDSEENASKFKPDANEDANPADEFIPLKRTEAKTNILESMGEPDDQNVSFFIDTKGTYNDMDTSTQNSAKKNKRKHKQNLSLINAQSDLEANEIITEIPAADKTSIIFSYKSDKKKKKKNKSFEVSLTGNEPVQPSEVSFKSEHDKSNVAATEEINVSLKSDKKKKKNEALDASQIVDDTVPEETVNISLKSDKKKKNKNNSFNVSQIIDNAAPEEPSVNVSLNNDHKKKKNKSINVSEDIDNAASEEHTVNVSLNNDKKKKKNNSFNVSEVIDNAASEAPPVNVSLNNDKKKKKNNSFNVSEIIDDAASEAPPVNVSLNNDKKKKKNNSFSVSEIIDDAGGEPEEHLLEVSTKNGKNDQSHIAASKEPPVNVSLNSDKKKKKKNKSLDVSQIVNETGGEPEEPLLEVSTKNGKNDQSHIAVSEETTVIQSSVNSDKKKKKKNKSLESQDIEAVSKQSAENVSKSDKKKKKKNISHDVSQIIDNTGEESDEAPLEVAYKSVKYDINIIDPVVEDNTLTGNKNKFKKKKKKSKNAAQPQKETTTLNDQEGEVSSKKRKRDMSSAPATDAAGGDIKMAKNQTKKRKTSQNGDDNLNEEGTKIKSKKRKATEDDYGQKKPKVFKENAFDKIHVPRLPESIVNQLGDLPPKESKKQKKVKAISTVPFEVEEGKKRKNKPSTYLEESVYLNNSPVKQKQKSSIKNPKVLPFIPTAITSGKGYTSNFRINVLPQETQFIAQASDMTNFKNEYLSNQRIKKLKTFERFKRERNYKLSKF